VLTKERVTGAATTSMIPNPVTSPVLIGELPIKVSPCDEVSANEAPVTDCDD
jgi:hypothetical protein